MFSNVSSVFLFGLLVYRHSHCVITTLDINTYHKRLKLYFHIIHSMNYMYNIL
jgi:hypothetical protein